MYDQKCRSEWVLCINKRVESHVVWGNSIDNHLFKEYRDKHCIRIMLILTSYLDIFTKLEIEKKVLHKMFSFFDSVEPCEVFQKNIGGRNSHYAFFRSKTQGVTLL